MQSEIDLNKDIIMNPNDLAAIEAALRFRGNNRICMISLARNESENILKGYFSLGIDNIVLLCDQVFSGSDTYATSFILSHYIRKFTKYKLIFCGTRSIDGGTGYISSSIAEHLGIPNITNVIKVKRIDEQYLYCVRKIENDILTIKVKLPAVVSIQHDAYQIRLPSISELVKSENRKINVYNAKDLQLNTKLCGDNGSYTKVMGVKKIRKSRKVKCIKGNIKEQTNSIINELERLIGDIYG